MTSWLDKVSFAKFLSSSDIEKNVAIVYKHCLQTLFLTTIYEIILSALNYRPMVVKLLGPFQAIVSHFLKYGLWY